MTHALPVRAQHFAAGRCDRGPPSRTPDTGRDKPTAAVRQADVDSPTVGRGWPAVLAPPQEAFGLVKGFGWTWKVKFGPTSMRLANAKYGPKLLPNVLALNGPGR